MSSRYVYDINTTTRYIDVNRQFGGGLKTVDTDDSLKEFYLRDAENVSISPFNFIEKRYGLHALRSNAFVDYASGDTVQGYFEYSVSPTVTHYILFFGGYFYVDTGTGYTKITTFVEPLGTNVTTWEGFAVANFQKTRPVEGVRIDANLYIATGTYPVYYKGDGKIYYMPQYEPNDLDLQNLSYNLITTDLAAYMTGQVGTVDAYSTRSDEDVLESEPLTIKNYARTPLVPYVNMSPQMEIELSCKLYDNLTYTYWNTGIYNFDSSITDPYGTSTNVSSHKYLVRLRSKVYRRLASGGVSDYVDITPAGSYVQTNDKSASITNDVLTTTNAAFANIVTNIPTPDSGYYDYKIEVELVRTGYELEFGSTYSWGYAIKDKVLDVKSVELLNVWVTTEAITDYEEAPLPTLRVHSCNRIREHNGRLLMYGNPDFPDWLFFSEVSVKDYFPYGNALQFTNELGEAIEAVTKFMNILVVQSPSYTWGLKGQAPQKVAVAGIEPYTKFTINPTIGCVSADTARNVRNQLLFLSKEGVVALKALYAEDNRYNIELIDRNIENIVPVDTSAVAIYFDDMYWLASGSQVLRFYLEKKAWVLDVYRAWNSFSRIAKFINKSGKLRFITDFAQLNSGDNMKVFEVEVDSSLPSDLGKTFKSVITTAYLNQNYPFHPKNYKEVKLDYTLQNEYNVSREPITAVENTFVQSGTAYIAFDATLVKRHFYQFTFAKSEATGAYSVYLNGVLRKTGTLINDPDNPTSADWAPIEFQALDEDDVSPASVQITVGLTDLLTEGMMILYDSTYDNKIKFTNVVLSEEGTLNIDPVESYDQATLETEIDLGTRTGNWVFGESEFGNVITAVSTIKLSGRGYNCKIHIVDESKAKWTLESTGITYKMKKARSR